MKKLIEISLDEKTRILNLHNVLKEQETLGSIVGIVKNEESKPVEYVKVQLVNSQNKIIKQITGDLDGNFKITNIPLGPYKLFASADGYKPNESQINVKQGENKVDLKLVESVTEAPEMLIPTKSATILDFYFVDENNFAIGDGVIKISKGLGNTFYDGVFQGGGIRLIYNTNDQLIEPEKTYKENKNSNGYFFNSDQKGFCKEKKTIKVKITKEGFEDYVKSFDICIKNASFAASVTDNKDNTITITPVDAENGIIEKVQGLENSNVFTIKLEKIKEEEKEEVASSQEEVTELRSCKKLTMEFYNDMLMVYNRKKSIADYGEQYLINKRKNVENCYIKYMTKYNKKMQKMIISLSNTPTRDNLSATFELGFPTDVKQKMFKLQNQLFNENNNLDNIIQKTILEYKKNNLNF